MKTHYGKYGGQYVAETLMEPLNELAQAYAAAKADPVFQREFIFTISSHPVRYVTKNLRKMNC